MDEASGLRKRSILKKVKYISKWNGIKRINIDLQSFSLYKLSNFSFYTRTMMSPFVNLSERKVTILSIIIVNLIL